MRASRASPTKVDAALQQRRRRAYVLLVVLFMTLVLWGVATHAFFPGVLQEATKGETWESSSLGVFDELKQADSGVSELSENFQDEVLSLEGLFDIRVARRGAIVGFSSAKSCEKTFEDVSSELEVRGWTRVESGSNVCSSFVKNTGSYRWVFVSCVAVGDATSVVVQSVSEDEGN